MGDRRLAREVHISARGLRIGSDRAARAVTESERERKGVRRRKKKGTRRYLPESRRDTKRPSAAAGLRIAVYLAPTTTTRWLLLPCPVRWIRRLAVRLPQGRSFRVGVTPRGVATLPTRGQPRFSRRRRRYAFARHTGVGGGWKLSAATAT